MRAILLAVGLFVFASAQDDNTVDPNIRVDCFPQPGATQTLCEARGCIWDSTTYPQERNIPACYFPKTTGLFTISHNDEEWILIKEQFPKVPNNPLCPYGQDIELLKVTTKYYGSILNLRIEPKEPVIKRFEPDIKMLTPTEVSSETLLMQTNGEMLNETFSFKIIRNSTKTPLWDTSLGGLMYADKYIQIATKLPSEKMYGFGENAHQTLKHNFTKYKTWSMLARDEAPNSVGEDTKNLYGVHPFYIMLEPDGRAHGVFILNSNAQEVTTGPGPHLVYRTIGGILDVYFFPGPTPTDVVAQYLSLIGKPAVPPFWALGFQLSRYGYKDLNDLKSVVERNLNASIPLDVIYADIDYMQRYTDFTTGDAWKGFGDYVETLHNKDMNVILIFDPAIDVESEAFGRALKANASFIEYARKDQVQTDLNSLYPTTKDTKIMLSVVWPDNHVAFPDFYDPEKDTAEWWIKEFVDYHKQVGFDGIWIDMNEPAAFGTNEDHPWYYDMQDHPNITSLKCTGFDEVDSVYDKAPFQTNAVYRFGTGALLSQKTLCMLARTNRGKEIFYNTKNLYGLYEAMHTFEAAKQATGKRPAVISRSTFPSSGRYAGHWLGDNSANWDDLRTSIIGAQEFNMFGIPYIGSDVCGFNGATTEELCLRWQQMGAFHPFFRNHNNNNSPPQDPAMWQNVSKATRQANRFRYSYLSYLYSLHFEAGFHGRTVIRPVFFEFPEDPLTHDLDFQFMWGDSMMIVPVTQSGVQNVSFYLPPSSPWYSLRAADYGALASSGWTKAGAQTNELIPVLIRGGKIVPKQEGQKTASQTHPQRMSLVIAAGPVSDNGTDGHAGAYGQFYWDDGISVISSFDTYPYCEIRVEFLTIFFNSSVTINLNCTGHVVLPPVYAVEIFGYPFIPDENTLMVNGAEVWPYMSEFDPDLKTLKFETGDLVILQDTQHAVISWQNIIPTITPATTTSPTTITSTTTIVPTVTTTAATTITSTTETITTTTTIVPTVTTTAATTITSTNETTPITTAPSTVAPTTASTAGLSTKASSATPKETSVTASPTTPTATNSPTAASATTASPDISSTTASQDITTSGAITTSFNMFLAVTGLVHFALLS